MSEFKVEVVKIGKTGKHPNADNLSITQVYNYPVIFRTGDFKEGDTAVYIPVEALLPNNTVFSFLWENKARPSPAKRTVKAKKLRGVFSMGLLMPVKILSSNPEVGEDVGPELGIKKYEEDTWESPATGGASRVGPGWFQKYTDIENGRKYSYVLELGEEVIITEKIHGSSGRFGVWEGEFFIGSRTMCKYDEDKHIWGRVATLMGLEDKLQAVPGIVVCGEVYGNVQKGYPYNKAGDLGFLVYDAYDRDTGAYLEYDHLQNLCSHIGLPMVPMLYKGPWKGLDFHMEMSDGLSMVPGTTHNREGMVIRPSVGGWHPDIGRRIVKVVGESYLLSKEEELTKKPKKKSK